MHQIRNFANPGYDAENEIRKLHIKHILYTMILGLNRGTKLGRYVTAVTSGVTVLPLPIH